MNETAEVDYAKRTIDRQNKRNAERSSTMPTEERLRRQVAILADRLALALHIMSDHEQFLRHETTVEQMKYLEDWVEELLSLEADSAGEGRARRFDYYRKARRYGYVMQSVRALLRKQIHCPPTIPKLGEK